MKLSKYGDLDFKDDHWECLGISTAIGLVDVQVDEDSNLSSNISSIIEKVLNQVTLIDALARKYLRDNAGDDIATITLVEPSFLFFEGWSQGCFTLFFSNEDGADDMCYGVEFRDMEPFDLTIGD